MLIFGDTEFELDLPAAAQALAAALSLAPRPNLDLLRPILARCGQLEQGAEDALAPETPLLRQATDSAARAFLNAFLPHESATWNQEETARLQSILARLAAGPPRFLRVKVPEGFQFYALYPEQYILSVHQWVANRRPPQPVLVIGIRSIGTTLSALCLSTLHSFRIQASRVTVRPRGHPFDRITDLPASAVTHARCAIIVDEGPGLSGSSMASVARALEQSGNDQVTFFPGHSGPPGNAGAEWVRDWWRRAPRVTTRLEEVRWQNRNLPDHLAAIAAAALAAESCATATMGVGDWRRFAYPEPQEWPAICPAFERLSVVQTLPGDSIFFWRFSGFAAANPEDFAIGPASDSGRPGEGRGLQALGFSGISWPSGRRAIAADGQEPEVARALARHCAQRAGPLIPREQVLKALARLTEMLRVNAVALLDNSVLPRIETLAQEAQWQCQTAPRHGDGQLAPHHWVRSFMMGLKKAEPLLPVCDHTLVGQQPLWWDIAGALVEFDLAQSIFLQELSFHALLPPASTLEFYLAAYAALRASLMEFSLQAPQSPDEQARLRTALKFYTAKLQHSLKAAI